MTRTALAQGMSILMLMWSHRATDAATVRDLTSLYGEILSDLSDEAWLSACRAAVRTCKHFPVPAELIDLAEAAADTAYQERITAVERQRINTATVDGIRLLSAGSIGEEQAAANQQRLSRMAADTLKTIRENGQRAQEESRRAWLHERHAARHQRIAEHHWETPEDETA